MHFLIATDAYTPQVNGVVRTYQRLAEQLEKLNHHVTFLTPKDYKTIPCPTYPEIRLALVSKRRIKAALAKHRPDAIHIATEGPIGWATRAVCLKAAIPFTTAYHTRFPEYVVKRFPLPLSLLYGPVRRFHNAGVATMVATPSLKDELAKKGFQKLCSWTRGVDTELFYPRPCRNFGEEPVALYVGRVAVEKNLEAFLDLPFSGRKVVVGDGPSLKALKQRYPEALFTGKMTGEALAECYSSADVFVFPSLTDTFGIVILEAMASGLPIAAFPVTGPIDIVEQGVTGSLSNNLGQAMAIALQVNKQTCREKALSYSWENCARMFICNMKEGGALS